MFFRVVLLLALATSAAQTQTPSNEKTGPVGESRSSSPTVSEPVAARRDYVGDEACRACHQNQVETYYKTAHHLTSRVADKNSVVGTFGPGANILKTSNPNLYFRMDSRDDGFFQTAMFGQPPKTWSRTERLDLVTGSGGKGQTYLFWDGDSLFQLPVGYSSVYRQWIDNPGYVDGTANFERPIIPRCLECHATYFEALEPPSGNRYDSKNFVLGISCERCHGPGREHVAIASSKASVPEEISHTIVNPAKLTPARQFDVCAQCHGGAGVHQLAPAFSYIPGQPLEKYIDLGTVDAGAEIDVHGKQVLLLKKSRCFQVSGKMSCSTCHDVHQSQRDLADFSRHCLTCHQVQACGMYPKIGQEIARNCIDCHMPNMESKVLSMNVNGKKESPRVRTHWIKVYPENPGQQP
jgi:Cytochrome c554 and c-prime